MEDLGIAVDQQAVARLRGLGIRPTRQRIALSQLLWKEDGHRHVTAEELHRQALDEGLRLSLATVYNTLNQFSESGLLRRITLAEARTYFCTNTAEHHHFYNEDTGELTDIPGPAPHMANLPPAPDGCVVASVDVVVRLRTRH